MTRNPFAMSVLAIVTLGHAALLYASRPAPIRPPQPLPLVTVSAIDLADTQAASPARAPAANAVAVKREARPIAPRQAPAPVHTPPAPRADSALHQQSAAVPALPAGGATAQQTSPTPAESGSGSESVAIALPQYRGDYLHNPKPAYPPLSLELGEEGTTELRVDVSANGDALTVELARSSGYPRLDRAAREAVKRWRFIPARRGSQAIAHSFVIPVNFSLKSVQS